MQLDYFQKEKCFDPTSGSRVCLQAKYLLAYSEKGEFVLSVKILTIDLVIAKLEYLPIDPD